MLYWMFLTAPIFIAGIGLSDTDKEKQVPNNYQTLNLKVENPGTLVFDLYCNGFYLLNEKTNDLSEWININHYLKNENNAIHLAAQNYPYDEPTSELTISITASKKIFTGKMMLTKEKMVCELLLPNEFGRTTFWQESGHLKLSETDMAELRKITVLYIDNIENGTQQDIGNFIENYYLPALDYYQPKADKKICDIYSEMIYYLWGKGGIGDMGRIVKHKAINDDLVVGSSPYDNRVAVVREKSRMPVLYIESCVKGEEGIAGDLTSVKVNPALNFIFYNNKWQLY